MLLGTTFLVHSLSSEVSVALGSLCPATSSRRLAEEATEVAAMTFVGRTQLGWDGMGISYGMCIYIYTMYVDTVSLYAAYVYIMYIVVDVSRYEYCEILWVSSDIGVWGHMLSTSLSTKAIWLASKTSMTAEALSSHPRFTAKTVVADKKMVWEKKRHVRAISKKGRHNRTLTLLGSVCILGCAEISNAPKTSKNGNCSWGIWWFAIELGFFGISRWEVCQTWGTPQIIQNGLSVWGETHGFGAPTVRKLQVIRFPPSMEEEDAIEARRQWAEDGRWFGFWKL